jgi:Arc/MetJ-type ribon-helix-helix transcriptional regulator
LEVSKVNTVITVKMIQEEIELLDFLRGGSNLASRSDVLRDALLDMARRRHLITQQERLAIADHRDKEHKPRRRRREAIKPKRKGAKS